MSTLWTLREQGVRWTYAPHVKIFFFVEKDFYKNYKDDLQQFCVDTDSDFTYAERGGWIQCSSDEAVLLFMLKWS